MPAPKYPQEMKEAIWAGMQDGMTPKPIQEALRTDQFGLGQKWDVPYRSVTDIMQKLKLKRGNPETLVLPGKESDAASALRRQLLAMARDRTEYFAKKARTEPLSEKEWRELDTLLKLVDGVEERLRRRETKDNEMAERQAESQNSPRKDFVAKIREDELARKRDERAASAQDADASSESQAPATPGPSSDEPQAWGSQAE